MAIAFNSYAEVNEGTATSTSTVAITATGSDGLVVVAVIVSGGAGANSCTGVTYDGNAFTQIGSQQAIDGGSADRRISMWYYLAGAFPGTSKNVVASFSGSTNNFPEVRVATYTGVQQSAQPDASNQYANAASVSSAAALNVTTVADNSLVVSAIRDNTFGDSTSVTNVTRRNTLTGTMFGDSNGGVTPAGSTTQTWTYAGAFTYGAKIASFAPAIAATTRQTLTMMGIGS